ncbi:unnamed protein product [Schistocephalus solidus]|uniref:Uncharacterized protein n=1 Tax=Schistocephalus solidus TaxID=70667 RepID=A0A183TM21_SCHSO|nr:unnamed protein product [Schistocephalus solidus]
MSVVRAYDLVHRITETLVKEAALPTMIHTTGGLQLIYTDHTQHVPGFNECDVDLTRIRVPKKQKKKKKKKKKEKEKKKKEKKKKKKKKKEHEEEEKNTLACARWKPK